jgi:CTP synthase
MPHSDSDASSGFLSQFSNSEELGEHFSPSPPGYVKGRTRFVVVIGTVMSGLGKGIFASSLAKLLQDKGLSVAPVKLEGYLNIDSGTLNPYRHGEVFVLDDGLETDMDLGTYERILGQNLSRSNFMTAGQIYTEILECERRGGYLGRDVQMIPHVTGVEEIARTCERVLAANKSMSSSSKWVEPLAIMKMVFISRPCANSPSKRAMAALASSH